MFQTNRIQECPGRYAAILAGVVPLIGIFAASAAFPTSSNEGVKVIGRPHSGIFTFVWIGITLILLFVSIIGALRLDVGPLIALSIGVVIFALISMFWLFENNKQNNKGSANQVITGLVFATLFLLVIGLTGTSDTNEDMLHIVFGSLLTVPVGWSLIATLLGFIDANIQ